METHFCTCPVAQYSRHPGNHEKGCDACIQDNLTKMKRPTCFFLAVNEDVSEVKEYSIQSSVELYLEKTGKA